MKSRPRTIVINSRCDIRSVATLHRFWQGKGYANLNMSQLIRLSVDHFADVLVANELVEPFNYSAEALAYVEETRLKHPGGNHELLVKQIQRETLLDEGFGTEYVDAPVRSLYGKPKVKVKKSLIEQARELMTKTKNEETLTEAVERREKEQQETKNQLGKLPEKE